MSSFWLARVLGQQLAGTSKADVTLSLDPCSPAGPQVGPAASGEP